MHVSEYNKILKLQRINPGQLKKVDMYVVAVNQNLWVIFDISIKNTKYKNLQWLELQLTYWQRKAIKISQVQSVK